MGVAGADNGGNLTAPEGSGGSGACSSALSCFALRNTIDFAISAARLGGSVKGVLANGIDMRKVSR